LIFNSSLGNTSVPDSLSSLQHAKIDLYLTSFLQPDEIRSKCFASLSHSERARTGSDQQGSWRFIFSRGTMRLLLARSLRCHPTELEIRSNPHGKPYLPDLAMHFNLSHTADLLVCALSTDAELGVDVERVRQLSPGAESLLLQTSGIDRDKFASLSAEQRCRSLIEWWTHREALGKAIGLGMIEGIRNYELTVAATQAPAATGPQHPAAWSIVGFDPGSNCCGAVAARARSLSIRLEQVNWSSL